MLKKIVFIALAGLFLTSCAIPKTVVKKPETIIIQSNGFGLRRNERVVSVNVSNGVVSVLVENKQTKNLSVKVVYDPTNKLNE